MKFKIGDKVQYTLVPSSGIWYPGTVHDFIYGNQEIIGYDICDVITRLHHSISEYGVKPYTDGDTDGDVKITVGDKVPDISKPRYSIGDKVVVKTGPDKYEIGSIVLNMTYAGMYKALIHGKKPQWYAKERIEGVTKIEDDKWYFVSKEKYRLYDFIGFRIHKIDGTPEIVEGYVICYFGEDRYKVRFIDGDKIQKTTIEVESKDIIGLRMPYERVPDFLTKTFHLINETFAPGAKVMFCICGESVNGTIVRKGQYKNGVQMYLVKRDDGGGETLLVAEDALILKGIKEPVMDCSGMCVKASIFDEWTYANILNEINKQDKGEKEMDYSKCYRENQENQKSRKVNVLPVKVIYHNPATIVFWGDGTKTVVKASSHDEFNEYAGFCAALAKKVYGTSSMVRRIVGEGTDELSGKKVKDIQETPKAPAKKPATKKAPARKTVKKAPAKKPAAKTEKTEETAK